MEQFANQCSTSIASGGYVAGSGVLNVASTGVPWPTTGIFTVQLQNPVLTLLRVTAVNSGTQWAVTPEANDLSTSAGTTVLGTVLSAAVVRAISFGNNFMVAAYTPIVAANWATFGSGGARTDVTNIMPGNGDAIEITGKTGSQGVYGVYRTVPSGDFSYDLIVWPSPTASSTGSGNYSPQVSVGFTDGNKTQSVSWTWNGASAPTNYLYITTSQAPSLTGASYAGANGQVQTGPQATASSALIGGPVPVRLIRTGTTYTGSISLNGGITYTPLFVDTSPFLTASAIHVSSDPRGNADASRITLISSTLQ